MLQITFNEISVNEHHFQWREEILQALESTKSEALSMEDYLALKKKQDKLLGLIKRSGKQDDVGQLLDIEAALDKFRLHFYTLPELKFTLEKLGCPPADLPKILAHQNACADAAQEVQAGRIIYMVELSQSPYGHPRPYVGHASVRVFHREDCIADEIHETEAQIRNAPKRQGLNFSKDQMRNLNMLYPYSFSF